MATVLVAVCVAASVASVQTAAGSSGSVSTISAEGTHEVTINTSESGSMYTRVTLVAPGSGFYTICTLGDEDTYLEVWSADESGGEDAQLHRSISGGDGDNASVTVPLSEGRSYIIRFAFYDSDEGDIIYGKGTVSYTVTKEEGVSATGVSSGKTYSAKITSSSQFVLFSITPSKDADYTFCSKGMDLDFLLFDSSYALVKSLSGEDKNTFSVEVSLDEGSTYYVFYRPCYLYYTGSFTVSVSGPTNLSYASVELSDESFVYTGRAHEPDVAVLLDGSPLVEDEDYTVDFADSVCAGTATATVTACGDVYSGSTSATYTISKATVSAPEAEAGLVYTGEVQTGVAADSSGLYTVSGGSATDAGSYTATVTLADSSNYRWEGTSNSSSSGSLSVAWEISAQELSSGNVSVSKAKLVYTGAALEPSVVVRNAAGERLDAGTDFELDYSGNENAGTGTVSVSGVGNYEGSVQKTFAISKAANTVTVRAKVVTVKNKTKAGKLAKSIMFRSSRLVQVSKKRGKTTFTRVKVTRAGKKVTGSQLGKIKVSKNGKVRLKKGLKSGTYKVKLKVRAAGTANYKAATRTVTVKIKVK